MSFSRNKNCLLRFVKSMVSISTKWMSRTPLIARFLTISQPRPPAPTTSTGIWGISVKKAEPSNQSSLNGAGLDRRGLRLGNSCSREWEDISSSIKSYLIIMSLEDKLVTIFKEPFQIKRVSKEIETLRSNKEKLGLQNRYSLTRGTHLTVFVEILRPKLKEFKKLSFLNKLEFKVVLKASYPSEPPRVYFLSENVVEFGLNPFHNYLPNIFPEWTPKITLIDIVKYIPNFLVECIQRNTALLGQPLLSQFFQAERLFLYPNVQTFPVRLMRAGHLFQGMMALVNQIELVLLEQTSFQNSYSSVDFISILEVQSVLKHKTKPICSMLQIKRGGSKLSVEFHSDEYDTIISAISDAMRAHPISHNSSKSVQSDSSQEDDEEPLQASKPQNQQLLITDLNIYEVQSQVMILQSLVDNQPNSKNIKELVELLKKTVEYFSVKGDPKCQMYLKSLQTIMGNEVMQVLLESQDSTEIDLKFKKNEYQSIVDLV